MTFHTESRLSRTAAATGTATHTRYLTARRGVVFTTVLWWVRAWRWLVPATRGALRWVWGTVTPAGWLVIAALAALPIGLSFGWVELIGAGSVAAILLLASVPFLFGGHAYEVDLKLNDERVVAGSEIAGSVQITNISQRIALPGRVDIPTGKAIADVQVPLLRSGHHHDETLVIAAPHRGIIRVGPVTSVRTDPLGILKREVAWVDVHDIFVHPFTVSIPSTNAGFIRDLEGNPSSQVVDSDISFHAIREYAPGDSQRHIHWKSTAKTSQLMVRQFEETRRTRLAIMLSLDESEYASADEFEMAVSAAGSLGVRAIRDGRDIAAVASEEIPEFAKETVQSIRSLSVLTTRTLLDDLSTVESSGAVMTIERVCALASQVVNDMSIAFVICGSNVVARRLQSIATQFPANIEVVAVVCNQAAAPEFHNLNGIRVMTIGLLEDLKQLMARTAR